jgi:flagellar assembly protein FliH
MISPFEANPEGETPSLRAVYPLEFENLNELSAEETVDAITEQSIPEREGEEVDALAQMETHLRSQVENGQRQAEAIREEARAEIREEMLLEFEEKTASERESVAKICEQFSRERTRYFAAVEAEVVRLTLAIAARVLHREIAMDPFLLQGVVKVALEKMQESGAVTFRVPEEQVEKWGHLLSDESQGEVAIIGDSRLQAGECVFETRVGRVDLGVKAQMEEIEKGFFDLLQRRPA